MRRHAHRLKGAGRLVGAHEVAAIAEEIEGRAVARADGIAGRADALDAALVRVAGVVRAGR